MMNGYITYTQAASGEWVCWLTEKQPPRFATIEDLFFFPGEVHFGMGPTKEAAFAHLHEMEAPVTRRMRRHVWRQWAARETRRILFGGAASR